MANNLTGSFEAVVQISARQINGLLATLHQNGAQENPPLHLLHSIVTRLGDPRRPTPGDLGPFGDWVLQFQEAVSSGGLDGLRDHLTAFAPPGAARELKKEFSKFGQSLPPPPPPQTIRGTVRAQLSAPFLSFPSGSTSEITLHVDVRAHYTPDAGTTDLPKPVHGEVQVTFVVSVVQNPRDHRRPPHRTLVVQPSPQDSKIVFLPAPGTGLTTADVNKLSTQVRKAVRESFEILPVALPAGFPFSNFKGLGIGSGQALALPIQLSGAQAPAGGIQNINNLFIGPSGFAVAVGKEFITTQFQQTLNDLKAFRMDIDVSYGLGSVTYHVSATDATLKLNNGSIDLTVKAKATNPHLPDFNNIVIKQRFTLVLFLDSLFISALDQDPDLTISGLELNLGITSISLPTGGVRNAIIAARNQVLPQAQAQLNTVLHNARDTLVNGLKSFDGAASASFRAGDSEQSGASATGAIAITPDGVILRGDIRGGTRFAPIVTIAETDQGPAFTALESWVPGGRIDRFIWSWVEYPGLIPSVFSGVVKSSPPEPHRFIFPKPSGITQLSQICLRIEGTQTLPDGSVVNVTGGSTCHAPVIGGVLELPSWWEPVPVPIWIPGTQPGTVLNEAIAGHISMQSDAPRKNELSYNTLVVFPDWKAKTPLAALGRAVARVQRKSFSLVVIVVLPAGAFKSSRREVEAKLASIGKRFPAQVLPTEDYEGGWTRTFAVSATPSTYLVNAVGKFVWKQEGEAKPEALAAALDQHLVPAPAPRFHPLRLAVSPGSRALEVAFDDQRGQRSALHRLRGQPVLLNFWQSWSAPCIKELRRLQQVHSQTNPPFIVAFHAGDQQKAIDQIRKQNELTFPLVEDTGQQIARMYGVRCWPTTISVNADGIIDHVQFGFRPERVVTPKGQKAKSR